MFKLQYASPKNFGAGSLDRRDVDNAGRLLRQIEALQHQVAST
jgi:hypothetical protein